MNYADLCTNVQSYLENTFTATQLDGFARAAEQRIYNVIQLPDLRKNVTGIISKSNPYVSCPTDFLAAYSMAAIDATGKYFYLLNKDVNYMREAYPNPTSTGEPRYYSIFGPRSDSEDYLSLIVAPTPDADYTTELHYYYYPASIVTAGNTWLGNNFDSALLYGMIVEAYTFMKGDTELLAIYNKRYEEAMIMLKSLSEGKDRSDAYRSGQSRIPVK